MRPRKLKYKFALDLLRLLNEGALLTVKVPGFELSAGGMVAVLAAFVLAFWFLS